MTQEEKDLLLKDICARLPYGVIVHGVFLNCNKETNRIQYEYCDKKFSFEYLQRIETIKPYLRSLSSMTEEERWDFGRIFNSFEYLKLELLENGLSFHEIYDITGMCDITWNELNTAIDWLNAHHFDYRGLIEKGLALPAPEGMYNF